MFRFNFKLLNENSLSILDSRILSKCYSILEIPGLLCQLLIVFLIRYQ